jgi:serine protease Do
MLLRAMLPAACGQSHGTPRRVVVVRILILVAAAFAALSTAPLHADPADIAAASRSVVRVVLVSDDGANTELVGHGSGIAVAPDLIVTNAHVVEATQEFDEVRIGVVPPQGRTGWFAEVIAFSPRNDLALLKLTERGSLPAATLYTGAVADGADVFAIGYPANVDLAQGLNIAEMMSPTTPVKTRGNVSAGRTSKAFDTILHTAAIGAGNSGGALLDACGRVVGVNSFGAMAEEGDSEFYFAVSMREIMRFLTAAGVKPQVTGAPCRSIADLDRSEAERLAGERALSGEEAQKAEAQRRDAERKAQLQIIASRENGMALAGLALLLALVAGGGAYMNAQKGNTREVKIAGGVAIVLLIGGVVAWLARPSLDDIEERAREIVAKATPSPAAKPGSAPAGSTGKLMCVLVPNRSRVTVSDMADVPLSWREDGCVNGRTQYGLGADGWWRVMVPEEDDTVTVSRFDPAARTYTTERYLLDLDTMTKLREERAKFEPPVCGAGEEAARKLGDAQTALKVLLPPSPNERLVYNCTPQPGG